jgi:hypothetical protein
MEEMREGSDTEIPSGDTVKELSVERSCHLKGKKLHHNRFGRLK